MSFGTGRPGDDGPFGPDPRRGVFGIPMRKPPFSTLGAPHGAPPFSAEPDLQLPALGTPDFGAPPQIASRAKHNWIGILGDALAGAAGQQGPYAAMLRQRQDMAAQEAAAQRRRADGFADWQRQQEYKAAHPDPVEPTAIQRNYDWLKANHPEVADQYLQTQTQAPPVVVTNSDGTKTLYPAGAIPRGNSALPAKPVGRLTPIEGGAGPQGPVSFR